MNTCYAKKDSTELDSESINEVTVIIHFGQYYITDGLRCWLLLINVELYQNNKTTIILFLV